MLLVAMLLVIFGHAIWSSRSRRRNAALLARAHALLNDALEGPRGATGDMTFLTTLPLVLQIRLLAGAAVSLSGTAAARLTVLAATAGLTSRALRWCRSRRWWRRLRGVRLLTVTGGGDDIVPLLLRDPNPFVRAQAAECSAHHPTANVMQQLFAALAGGGHLFRFAVQDALSRIGAGAIEPMNAYLATHTGPQVEPVLAVAIGLPDGRLLPAALRFTNDAAPRVRALAAALLGALGGEPAVAALTHLLQDPSAAVRAAAIHALGHLGEWAAVPRIAPLLRDQAWVVRKEAGLNLRGLGAPGLLYLRAALTDADPFAADMAALVLDLPFAGEPWSLA